MAPNETVYPKFTPMILDHGFADGYGMDTDFGLCYKMNRMWKFNKFDYDVYNSPLPFNDTSAFLNVFLSFSNETEDKFIDALR